MMKTGKMPSTPRLLPQVPKLNIPKQIQKTPDVTPRDNAQPCQQDGAIPLPDANRGPDPMNLQMVLWQPKADPDQTTPGQSDATSLPESPRSEASLDPRTVTGLIQTLPTEPRTIGYRTDYPGISGFFSNMLNGFLNLFFSKEADVYSPETLDKIEALLVQLVKDDNTAGICDIKRALESKKGYDPVGQIDRLIQVLNGEASDTPEPVPSKSWLEKARSGFNDFFIRMPINSEKKIQYIIDTIKISHPSDTPRLFEQLDKTIRNATTLTDDQKDNIKAQLRVLRIHEKFAGDVKVNDLITLANELLSDSDSLGAGVGGAAWPDNASDDPDWAPAGAVGSPPATPRDTNDDITGLK